MGLWSRLKMCLFPSNGTEAASEAICYRKTPSPVHQFLVRLLAVQEVHDEVISSGLFGQAVVFCPLVLIGYAPCSAATNVTNHSIGLTTDTGIEILIHSSVGTIRDERQGLPLRSR